ncbi:Lar family restriction alleviation protein [Paraburkholderia megapolitana]|uniref:Lar family restriction alleviation protein n=1 Tax=Paraburkholderia megapolitana TaxID=420953 RepID=UPI0038BCA51F
MIEQLIPCEHCGGRPTIGCSQRVPEAFNEKSYPGSVFGRDLGPPRPGDRLSRPPEYPPMEKLRRIHCDDCGMSTPWVSVIDDDETTALDHCASIWNRRLRRTAATPGDFQHLIEREIGAADIPFVLDLLARTDSDWEERGPLFAKLARRLIEATVVTFDSWPIDPVLFDAARYRKLVQLAKWIDIDGERHVQFPRIPTPDEHDLCLFEDRIALAVDAMPDRDRW